MSSPLKQNTTTIQNLLDTINSLPEAGTDLPELTNEGSASDLLSGKQLIDSDGNIVTGTIATKTASNLTASGATVTVPAGYYASQATKSVSTGSAKTPATTITKNPTISVDSSGKITASVSGTQNVTPTVTAGYVSSGTAGIITVSGSATHQLAFQPAKTITPSTVSQIAVSSGYYTGGSITVAAVPTQSKTVTPTSTTQNITPDSGKFLSKVTVAGDSDLVAENIKSGVNIFGVTGTYEGGGGDTSAEDGLITKTISGAYVNDRVTSIGSSVFYGCGSLTTASFPVATSIGSSAFCYCYSLTTVSFPKVTTIGGYAFNRCYNLKSLYLTGSSLCKLSNSNAFTSTPIGGYSTSAGTYGSIYVPASLLNSYKTATNWTYFSSRFVGI